MNISDKIYIGKLIDIYGGLLTQKQLAAVSGYYLNDLSLSEIADNEGITRQGAYDLVTKSKAMLERFEKEVLMQSFKDELKQDLQNLLDGEESSTKKQKINEILSKLE